MTMNDRISKMPPWDMARISREIHDALTAMGLSERTVDKLHYEAMGAKLRDVRRLIDVKPYLG